MFGESFSLALIGVAIANGSWPFAAVLLWLYKRTERIAGRELAKTQVRSGFGMTTMVVNVSGVALGSGTQKHYVGPSR